MRAAMLQITSTDNPAENVVMVQSLVDEAVANGATFILTPEVTNCLSTSRTHQQAVLSGEKDDLMLAKLQDQAAQHGVTILIGSLALKTDDPNERFTNRSFLVGPNGGIIARYDKIHMFDVDVSETESYRESAGYRPGDKAVLADAGFAQIGMSICYDIRFPHLYRALAQAGADILTVPSAFSPQTGKSHWKPLLQARAIENGCFVLAPAQTGDHGGRKTYGHSLAIDPWGDVIAEAGIDTDIIYVDLDMSKVAQTRKRIASLTHDKRFAPPNGQR